MSEKTQKNSWFKGLSKEFKRIIWPDKMTVAKQTAAVVSVWSSWELLSRLSILLPSTE